MSDVFNNIMSQMDVNKLISEIKKLMKTRKIKQLVDTRAKQFREMYYKSDLDWFSELCFCILTANSSAHMGLKIQEKLGIDGFLNLPTSELASQLKSLGYRFYNLRASFISEARKYAHNIRTVIMRFPTTYEARDWLVRNIKGIGYKEASHFLRNVGIFDFAILDRHILRTLLAYNIIGNTPKTLTRKRYLLIEEKFVELSKKVKISPGLLDLYIWYMNTGEILK